MLARLIGVHACPRKSFWKHDTFTLLVNFDNELTKSEGKHQNQWSKRKTRISFVLQFSKSVKNAQFMNKNLSLIIASVTIVLLTLSEKRERKSGQSDVMWHEKLLQKYALSRNDTCWCAFWRFTYMLHSEINWKIPSSLFYPHELSIYFCQRKFNSQFLPVFTMSFFFDSCSDHLYLAFFCGDRILWRTGAISFTSLLTISQSSIFSMKNVLSNQMANIYMTVFKIFSVWYGICSFWEIW